jgi:hypothetical protein
MNHLRSYQVLRKIYSVDYLLKVHVNMFVLKSVMNAMSSILIGG